MEIMTVTHFNQILCLSCGKSLTENLQGLAINVSTRKDCVRMSKEGKKHDEYFKI